MIYLPVGHVLAVVYDTHILRHCDLLPVPKFKLCEYKYEKKKSKFIQIQTHNQVEIQYVTYFHHMKTTCPIEVQDTVKCLGPPEFSVNSQGNENSLIRISPKPFIKPVEEELVVVEAVAVTQVQDLDEN